MWSLSECIPWMTVGLAECVAVVTINLCTIIAFIRNRNLRKRSTYLVINLAVIDMLAGGFAVCDIFYSVGVTCSVFKWYSMSHSVLCVLVVFLVLFPFCSMINITIIALERVHATFYPFKHRGLKKWVCGLIIAVVWVTAGLLTVANSLLVYFEETRYYQYGKITVCFFCLLIIGISYTSIVIKVRCGAQPQHHGAVSRERKLTVTLLIVTVVSMLLYLPLIVFVFIRTSSKSFLPLQVSVRFHLRHAISVLFFANSLVNPIIYAMRMPEYRSALLALFRKQPQQQRQAAVLPLRDM
ncbi:melanopsin-like [Orbicella faveolata]|uniref:melanopsin-like n=1 Tax=Orbicella faveolata TaxID=48498 RepID=UPI0009E4BFC6|nr:melanopsin-like [Orbicella faveolata]